MKSTVFGSTGLLGSALLSTSPWHETLGLNSKSVDLSRPLLINELDSLTSGKRDLWINAAARVGGIKANMDRMGEFYRDNVTIGNNVIEAARLLGVRKLVSVLSTCIYPNEGILYPLTEDQLHDGPPHGSNFGYAYAKRMLDVASRAYKRQWGCDFVTVVPNNLYGPHDNYDINGGHVIPSLIRKFYEAHRENRDVTVWGTGRPLREFTYSEDAARTIWWVAENYDGEEPINIGNTEEISIGDLASLIGRIVGFKGKIKFDHTKPDGQTKKPTSNAKLKSLGYKGQYTTLEEGLSKTVEFFVKNYPNMRGVT